MRKFEVYDNAVEDGAPYYIYTGTAEEIKEKYYSMIAEDMIPYFTKDPILVPGREYAIVVEYGVCGWHYDTVQYYRIANIDDVQDMIDPDSIYFDVAELEVA